MSGIELKTPLELATMRQAGRLTAQMLDVVREMAQPGVSTIELDRAAEEFVEKQGGKPAFKGYRGFPATLCTSLNDEVVHGIPGQRRLREGDLLKVDGGVIWEGYYGDAAVTLAIGDVTAEARALLEATREALAAGIGAIRPGGHVGDIGAAVQHHAESRGFSVVTDYTGHGIGRAMHEEPKVPNFVSERFGGRGPVLQPGLVIAIEPMVNVGTHRTRVLPDGWTVATRDGKLSAHFEHTVAVEEDGPVILTLP